jgi:hypothetical protein
MILVGGCKYKPGTDLWAQDAKGLLAPPDFGKIVTPVSKSKLSCDSSGLVTFVASAGDCCSGLATIINSSTWPFPNPKGRLLSLADLAVFVGEVGELSLMGSPRPVSSVLPAPSVALPPSIRTGPDWPVKEGTSFD